MDGRDKVRARAVCRGYSTLEHVWVTTGNPARPVVFLRTTSYLLHYVSPPLSKSLDLAGMSSGKEVESQLMCTV